MIQSKFKYTSEIGAEAGRLTYKIRSKKRDKWVNIFVPIGILAMVGVLIYDVVKSSNLVLDIVLLVMLLGVEILNIFMPKLIFKSQKKYLKAIDEQNFDYYISEYNKGIFKEKFYKDSKMLYCNDISIDKLVEYAEFDHYVLLIFSNYATLVFDANSMESGSIDELLKLAVETKINNRTKRRR